MKSLPCWVAAVVMAVTAAPAAAATVCDSFPGTRDRAVVRAETGTLSGKPVRTTYLSGGAYRTTTCDAGGTPRRAVLMAPQRLPDGTVAQLPVEEVERNGDKIVETSALRGDLRIYGGAWRKAVSSAKARGLAPLDPASLTSLRLPPRHDEAGVLASSTLGRQARASSGGLRFRPGSAKPRTADARRLSAGRLVASKRLAKASGTGDKCTLWEYSTDGSKLAGGFGYYVNWSLIGSAYHADFTQQTIYGFHTWQFGYNDCGWSNAEIVGTANFGTTSLTAASADGGSGTWNGGTNVVDAGALSASTCAGAVACAYTWKDASGTTILESNVRLSTAMPWTVGWQPGFYDIWSVVTHEGGHAIGRFADLYNASAYWAVMYGYVNTNDATKRLLSLGEYSYINALY
jgi:hypothetical protein